MKVNINIYKRFLIRKNYRVDLNIYIFAIDVIIRYNILFYKIIVFISRIEIYNKNIFFFNRL